MGSCKSKGDATAGGMTIDKFKIDRVIGRGGFGKVYIVEKKGSKTGEKFAMKEMFKARVMNKDSVESVLSELAFLKKID
jgi:serine/threonine protein kinase